MAHPKPLQRQGRSQTTLRMQLAFAPSLLRSQTVRLEPKPPAVCAAGDNCESVNKLIVFPTARSLPRPSKLLPSFAKSQLSAAGDTNGGDAKRESQGIDPLSHVG